MASRPGIQETYLAATRTSNLKLVYDSTCAADKLLAAGYVAQGSDRKNLALAVMRVLDTVNMQGIHGVADQLADMLVRRAANQGNLLARVTAKDISLMVLKLMARPKCQACGGLGKPRIAGTPHLDASRKCVDCHGTGEVAIERLVRSEHTEYARWLRGELKGVQAFVLKDMKAKLHGV